MRINDLFEAMDFFDQKEATILTFNSKDIFMMIEKKLTVSFFIGNF